TENAAPLRLARPAPTGRGVAGGVRHPVLKRQRQSWNQETIRFLRAKSTSSTRVRTPSLAISRVLYVLTVLLLMNRVSPMALLLMPLASSFVTVISRSDSRLMTSAAGRAAAWGAAQSSGYTL